MTLRSLLLAASLATGFFALSAPALAGPCRYDAVRIDPAPAGQMKTFAGTRNGVTLTFTNEADRKEIDAFPEPPVTVRTRGKSCEITDGGIWARGGVHVSRDGRRLMLHEYTGGNDMMVFYDAATCAKRGEIVTTGSYVTPVAGGLRFDSECSGEDRTSCGKHTRTRLTSQCLPR